MIFFSSIIFLILFWGFWNWASPAVRALPFPLCFGPAPYPNSFGCWRCQRNHFQKKICFLENLGLIPKGT